MDKSRYIGPSQGAQELSRTPAPVITVEPATMADVIEAGAPIAEVRNEDGDVMGYTYGATETGRAVAEAEVIQAVEVERVDPYDMGDRVRYTTPAPFRYPSDREDLSEFAQRFFGRCMEISREKNLRYAGALDPFKNFRLGGTYGIAIRMTDKVSRLLTLTEPGCKIDGADESVEDTCHDLANYAMLLAAMRSNERS